jgi:hypothetical protein
MQQINTVVHLGAARAGKGLADAEELLIDLLADPFDFIDEFVVKLSAMVSECCLPKA